MASERSSATTPTKRGSSPPTWAIRFLHWYCREDLVEEIEGDLTEIFLEVAQKKGPQVAKWQFAWHVLHFFQPFAWKKFNENDLYTSKSASMFTNYITIAYRSLVKKLGYSLVNISGLSVGIVVCLLMVIFVQYETSFDSFQKKDVYRLVLNRIYPERQVGYAFVPHSIGPQMVVDFPEVLESTRLIKAFGPIVFRNGENVFYEEKVIFSDSNVFNVLEIPLLEGDPRTALKENNAVVISERVAQKYFNGKDAIGQTFETDQGNFLVRGIAKNQPGNSHFEFDFLVSIRTFGGFIDQPNWTGFSVMTYLQLAENADPKALEAKLPEFIKLYASGAIQQRNGISYDEYVAAGNGYDYFLQPIRDIHLQSNLEGELKPNGNITHVYIFISSAVFILLIACINFMNLATARSVERAKEVGIRKVLGSVRQQLIYQFITESVLITLLSAILAVALLVVALPFFAELSGRDLGFSYLLQPTSLLAMIGGVLFIGFVAGIYPAFVLSSFNPAAVLKGKMQTSTYGVLLRNGLVVFQFAISISLISATIIIFDQMQYLLNKSMGFEKDQVLVVENAITINVENFQQEAPDPVRIRNRFETFQNELLKVPGVKSAAYTSAMPGDNLPGFILRVPGSGEKESMVARGVVVNDPFFETMQIKLKEGRLFSKQFNDSLSMILTESTVNKLGITDPIGKKIQHVDDGGIVNYTIVGVVNDFHLQSLHVEMEPLALLSMSGPAPFVNKMVLKLDPQHLSSTLGGIEEVWNGFSRNTPFRYSYLDQDLRRFYESEKTSGDIFTMFTIIAIVIACVGLFGLAAYAASQKRKEIGVRKVMGASVWNIVYLLSRDFTKLILIAVLVAVPFAWWGMGKWLENFAYRVDINVWTFALAALISILIGWATVSYQSFMAASANPVKSLRSE